MQEHIDKSFGIVGGGKVFGVRLLFSKNVAAYIRERIWHPSQQIVEKRDGSLELRFETAGWKELVRWILSWQPDVKVLLPKKLCKRVKEKLKQALERGRRSSGGHAINHSADRSRHLDRVCGNNVCRECIGVGD